MSVVMVTVTYGRRWSLLHQVLNGARAQGVSQAIVVDNGSYDDISAHIAEHFAGWAKVVKLERNGGSAVGFHEGIAAALGTEHDEILLLDDDNLLLPGALDRLIEAWRGLPVEASMKAVFAFRQDHGGNKIALMKRGKQPRIRDTFCEFHLFDLVSKVGGRVRRKSALAQDGAHLLEAQTAPYGGLFFHRAMIGRIGLPNTDYVLYQDDTDFTYRLTRVGGRLCVVLDAVVEDIDRSWTVSDRKMSGVEVWATCGSDLRVFYTMRNSAYWGRWARGAASPMFYLNVLLYISMIALACLFRGRMRRISVLLSAVTRGLAGKMGEHAEFSLG